MNEDNNYLKKQNNNLSLEPISKTLLNAERLTDQNLSNLGKQKLENFFEFFMQTISIIYFIYFIIVIYKTQVIYKNQLKKNLKTILLFILLLL